MEEKRIQAWFRNVNYKFHSVSVGKYVYLNCSQLIFLSRVIVHHNNKIIANMSLFIAASSVALPVWHQRGDVKNSCADITSLIISVVEKQGVQV